MRLLSYGHLTFTIAPYTNVSAAQIMDTHDWWTVWDTWVLLSEIQPTVEDQHGECGWWTNRT